MKNLTKRLSLSSVQRSGGSRGSGSGQDGQEVVALDKVLTKLIKGMEKACSKMDDRLEMAECAHGATADAQEVPDVAAFLGQLGEFHEAMKRQSETLRAAVERSTLQGLRGARTGPLKDCLQLVQGHTKAAEAVARDEKVNDSRHTPESKSRVAQSHEALQVAHDQLAAALASGVPDARRQLKEALLAYAAAFQSYFSECSRAAQALSQAAARVDGSGGGSSAAAGSGGGGASAGGGMGVFGGPLDALCTIDNAPIPRFVDDALRTIEAKALREPALFRADRVPEAAYEQLRQSVEKGDFNLQRANHLAVGACLKAYVAELPEPLFSYRLYTNWMDAPLEVASLKAIAKQLPLNNQFLLQRLFQLFEKLVRNSKENSLTAPRLAAIWAPSLLRPQKQNPATSAEDAAVASMIVMKLFELHADVFDAQAPPTVSVVPSTPTKVVATSPAPSTPQPSSLASSPAASPTPLKPTTGAGVAPVKSAPPTTSPSPVKAGAVSPRQQTLAAKVAAEPLTRNSAPLVGSSGKSNDETGPPLPDKKPVAANRLPVKSAAAPKATATPALPEKKPVTPTPTPTPLSAGGAKRPLPTAKVVAPVPVAGTASGVAKKTTGAAAPVSPKKTDPPAAITKQPSTGAKGRARADSYEGLDDSDEDNKRDSALESEDEDDKNAKSGGGFGVEDPDPGMPVHLAASQADLEDMQTLGLLGMMLSEEKRVGISPALDRKTSNW